MNLARTCHYCSGSHGSNLDSAIRRAAGDVGIKPGPRGGLTAADQSVHGISDEARMIKRQPMR